MTPDRIPTVIVADEIQTCAAAAAAVAAQLRLDVRSASWLADAAGPMVFAAMVGAARRAHPAACIRGVLDCGRDAGTALAALRHGLDVRLDLEDGSSTGSALRISAIALQAGLRVVEDGAAELDISDSRDPEGACLAWLRALAGQCVRTTRPALPP